MIPSKKGDHVATFQIIASAKSWVIAMEGNLGDDPSNRSFFILKILINFSSFKLNLCPPTLSVNPFHIFSRSN